MKIIVTGGSGFIGSRLVEALKGSYEVVETSIVVGDGSVFLDLTNPENFDYSLIQEGDFVFHLAAQSSPDFCQNEYDTAYNINVTGSKRFLSKCLEHGAKVVFFSSVNVYGCNNEGEFFDEESSCNPVEVYPEMKYELEKQFFGEKNFKIFRLSLVFAENDKFTSYLKGCTVAEVFDPFSRHIVYIGDVVAACVEVVEKFDDFENQIFNLCGEDLVSRKELAEIYKDVVDNGLEVKVVEPPKGFFDARPRIISTKSLYLEKLLGRKTLSMKEAMVLEFGSKN